LVDKSKLGKNTVLESLSADQGEGFLLKRFRVIRIVSPTEQYH